MSEVVLVSQPSPVQNSEFVQWRRAWARELGPKGIHVAHLIIDGGVDSPAIHARRRAKLGDDVEFSDDALIKIESVAEAFWTLSQQRRDGWTHELDLRPFVETW